MLVARTTTGSSTHGNALRARRDRGGRHRRHPAHRRPRHHRRHRPRRPDLLDAHATSSSSTTAPSPSSRSSREPSSSPPCCCSSGWRLGAAPPSTTPAPHHHQHHTTTSAPPPPHHIKEHHHVPAVHHHEVQEAVATGLVAGIAVALPRRLHQQRLRATTTTTTPSGGTVRGRGGLQRRGRRQGRHRLLGPRRRPRLDGLDHRVRQERGRRSTTTSSCGSPRAPTTSTVQISQVETFINDKVDAIVLLPFDGAAMTPVALKAMEAGIPVINVDREFDDPNAARVTVLGDNYGMGVSAGAVRLRAGRRQQGRRRRRDRRHRLAAADPGPQPGLRGRALRVRPRRRQPGRRRLHRRGRRGGRGATCSRPPRRSTSSGTTTTTRVSASSPRSRTPAATSSP